MALLLSGKTANLDELNYLMKRLDSFDGGEKNTFTLNTRYNSQCYEQRNRYMIDHSNRIICCWNGQAVSGTAETVRMAEKQKLEIINLYE